MFFFSLFFLCSFVSPRCRLIRNGGSGAYKFLQRTPRRPPYTKLAHIFNTEQFAIKHIPATEITVKDEERRITIPLAGFQRTFYVAYAMTVCKSQGSTFNHSYTIREWEKFSHRLKYVSLSRATSADLISIV